MDLKKPMKPTILQKPKVVSAGEGGFPATCLMAMLLKYKGVDNPGREENKKNRLNPRC
jgi:hypothetical protein